MSTRKIGNIVIYVIWTIIFACPLVFQYYIHVTINAQYNWHEITNTYIFLIAFFVLFAVHHILILPSLYARKHYWRYTFTVFALVCGFCFFLKKMQPLHHPKRPMMEERFEHGNRDKTGKWGNGKMPRRHETFERREFRQHKKHTLITPFDITQLMIVLLMFGVDIGFDAIMKSHEQRRRLTELEQQSLKQQLDYLKHQINPHFFMNTLNNIHVLIDIDQEKAKRSLVELSKLMRYTLYEGTGTMVMLSQEIDFISQYLSLMKLRYSDKVEIVSRMPETTYGIQIPPLLLVTFIENAFKHGVSYQNKSFIHIAMEVNEGSKSVHFECSNSRHSLNKEEDCGGIGLENVRKRLDLIYDKDYKLLVEDNNTNQYRVILELKSL